MSEPAAGPARLLASLGMGDWLRRPVAGDASARRYTRLVAPDGASAMLMEVPASDWPSAVAFMRLADHLRALGLAAPAILGADPAALALVVEDLGPDSLADRIDRDPQRAAELYAAAVDVLVALDAAPPPAGLQALGPLRAAGMIGPLFEWYAPGIDARSIAAITGRLQEALTLHAPNPDRLALRDYHAENLIWRDGRAGTDRVGLLDFQDAVTAPRGYDLVSLLRDARRDLAPDLAVAMLRRFAEGTGSSLHDLAAATAVLGVQRNLRILGIFARLARRDGKFRYLDFLPRVWRHVAADLSHPALARLAPLVLAAVPDPDAARRAWAAP
jgi:aminoglycoside/choline kinase family phosphotransferase